MIEAKDHPVTLRDGTVKTYVLSRFPSTVGREIATQYPVTAAPKIGDYKSNHELMLKLMQYVGVYRDDNQVLELRSAALIDNHVPDAETLMKLEWAMLEYNFAFFGSGKLSAILEAQGRKFMASIIEMLTASKPS